jgi:hypothetical protein
MQGMRIRAVAALVCGMAFLAVGCSDQASITDSLQMKKGPPVTEVSNSLSVPTIVVGGGGFTGVTCGTPEVPSTLVSPTGTPLTGYEIDPDAYYYVQRVSVWQAQCYVATAASAEADWGDNLAGDAKLKVGKPIRVELGLLTTDLSMQGFTVVKLEPSELDRVSAYGTLASSDDDGQTWYATAEYLAARVHDGQVTFSVQKVGETEYVIDPGSNPTAEINATGKVVYGYNMRVTEKGDYVITFVTPNVTLTGSQDGGVLGTTTEGYSTVSLTITVQ